MRDGVQWRRQTWAWRWLAASWLALLAGTVMLAFRYPELPPSIPLHRTLLGAPIHASPRRLGSVFRILLMGAGQLGATTVMAQHAVRSGHDGWVRFWVAASAAASAKTLVETLQLAFFTPSGDPRLDGGFLVAALFPVLAFLSLAARLWRARQLEPRAPLPASRVAAVVLSLLLWLVFATYSLWRRVEA